MAKRQYHQKYSAKRQKTAENPSKDGSNEEVLLSDIKDLHILREKLSGSADIESENTSGSEHTSPKSLPDRFSEIEVKISEISSTGDGLGFSSEFDHVIVVPFTVPGDVVRARIVNHFAETHYTLTDFVKITTPGSQRDDTLVKCSYFAKCAGCQIQMLPYKDQLAHKKTIIEKAYKNFSALMPEAVPAVGETIGSPLQYGYRTKLTPHFDGPPGSTSRKARRDPSSRKGFEDVPPIGFQMKGIRKTIDIEDCPIGTDAVRKGMKSERERVTREIANYTKGATILLRESTTRKPKAAVDSNSSLSRPEVIGETNCEGKESSSSPPTTNGSVDTDAKGQQEGVTPYIETKTCVTDSKAISTEYIESFEFKNSAGAFFQNNNSILPTFTSYIRSHVMPPNTGTTGTTTPPIKYLIDAYCGSGLFTVTLSSLFASSTGIDIASASTTAARENAKANNISNATFMTADAAKLFEEVTYPPENTVMIIDPPRKGCDDPFLQQLLRFGPQRVVYVSCNVHTQARDVGVLVEGKGGCKYEIESLQGFDFFPQTGHVEGVAVLARVMESTA